MTGTLLVGNCSGFYGDRISAMREMLEGSLEDAFLALTRPLAAAA